MLLQYSDFHCRRILFAVTGKKIQIIKSNVHRTDLTSNEIIIFLAVCLDIEFAILSSNASGYSFIFIDYWQQLPLTKMYSKGQNLSASRKGKNLGIIKNAYISIHLLIFFYINISNRMESWDTFCLDYNLFSTWWL